LIFDVKMDFTRKARFVAGGHMTETPASLTYSSVVSRESVRIAFAIAAVNKLKCLSCDIGNAYLNAECREKIWFVAGPECGDAEGKVCKLNAAQVVKDMLKGEGRGLIGRRNKNRHASPCTLSTSLNWT